MQLGLEGRPRNPDKPERPTNYGLSPDDDETLTAWMRTHLELAFWPKPESSEIALVVIENVVLGLLEPPLNLKGVVTAWTVLVKAARKVMADEARSWRPPV